MGGLNPLRRLLWRWGWKPYLVRCPKGRHDWRTLYGDERMYVGRLFLCRNCPRRSDLL